MDRPLRNKQTTGYQTPLNKGTETKYIQIMYKPK